MASSLEAFAATSALIAFADRSDITINVIKGKYEPDAPRIALLLTGVLVVFGRLAFSLHRSSGSDSNSD